MISGADSSDRSAGDARDARDAAPAHTDSGPAHTDAGALDTAVAEVEDFVGAAGWDAPRRLFALVDTAALLAAEPSLAGTVDGGSTYTPIAQDEMPGEVLADALAGISWPEEVLGCVLALGILAGDPGLRPEDQTSDTVPEGRLVVGVLRGRPGGSCLLRWRSAPEDPLRGPTLAPGVIAALQATFED